MTIKGWINQGVFMNIVLKKHKMEYKGFLV